MLTTEVGRLSFMHIRDSHLIKVVRHTERHTESLKWLGMRFGTSRDNVKIMLSSCSVNHWPRYFETFVSSTACFAAKHRLLYTKTIWKHITLNIENLFVELWDLHREKMVCAMA